MTVLQTFQSIVYLHACTSASGCNASVLIISLVMSTFAEKRVIALKIPPELTQEVRHRNRLAGASRCQRREKARRGRQKRVPEL